MNETNAEPLVSVIMIFLDEEKFIEEAIQSVLTQTYGNWELILVDDGSADQSGKMAARHAVEDPGRVRRVEHPGHRNRGMSASRNLGIREAGGKYITFLDADDVWLAGKLRRQVAIAESHPEAGFVCGPARWWYGWTGNPDDIRRDFIQTLGVPADAVVEGRELLILFLREVWCSLCDVLVRRELVEAVGGYEESFHGMFEDQVFHAKLCLAADAFVSSDCGYGYRQHPDACTASHRDGEYRSTRLKFLNWLNEYLSGEPAKNIDVRNVVQKELWPLRHPLLSRISACMRCL
jgi:glycosyltransferase involved in cell wall biosynthesis